MSDFSRRSILVGLSTLVIAVDRAARAAEAVPPVVEKRLALKG
jgi:hypothetical protein